jgi:peptidoglycan/LPS O-acetylase OafA/YrhL
MNKSLNSFRTFAFLAVFLYHAVDFSFGYLGVHAFFVLSGYLITPILLKTKHNATSFKNFLFNFYGRRSLRIFPPYYFYLLIVSLVIFFGGLQNQHEYSIFLKQIPWALTYTYDFYHATKFSEVNSLVTHFWSLAVEEQFYIFWPLVIYFTNENKLKILFLTLIISGPIIRILTGLMVDQHWLTFLNPRADLTIYILPFSHIDAFVTGGFFSLFVRKYVPSSASIVLSFVGILLIGFITSKVFTNDFQLRSFGYMPYMKDSFKYIWGYSLFSFFFSILLLKLNKRDFFPIVFENSLLNYLGKISYGLYIYHSVVLHWFFSNKNMFPFYPSSPLKQNIYTAIVPLILTIVLSIISFEFFEKYFLVWKDMFFPKNPAKAQLEKTEI